MSQFPSCQFLWFLLAAATIHLFGGINAIADRAADEAKVSELISTLRNDKFVARNRAAKELDDLIAKKPLWLAYYLANQPYQDDPETKIRVEKILQLSADGEKYKIVDAVGQPITDAIVETYVVQDHLHRFAIQGGELISRSLADEHGTISTYPSKGRSQTFSVRLYAPGYGLAGFALPQFRRDRPIRLPLPREGSQQWDRAPGGTVLDSDGKPVVHAAVVPGYVEAPGGSMRSLSWDTWALTDSAGKFRVYRTLDKDDEKLLPPNANIRCKVSSDQEDLFPAMASCPARQSTAITLSRGSQYHRFAFDAPDALMNKRQPQLYFSGDKPPGSKVELPQRWLREGAKLVPGRYEVWVSDLSFHPLTVTPDSDERLTFLPVTQDSIFGSVVDGISERPFENAIVFLYAGSGQKEFSAITDQQWQSLAEADAEQLRNHPTYKLLADTYNVLAVGKSNTEGRFELFPEQQGHVYGVIAMSAGKLPVSRRIPSMDELRRRDPKLARISRDVGRMPMYQAARLQAVPLLKGQPEDQNVNFWPEWQFEKEGQPEWFERFFLDYDKSIQGLPTFYPCQYLTKSNRPHQFIVPAGLQFKFALDSAYTESWSPLYLPQTMELEPNETVDLGELVSQPTVRAIIKVVDQQGHPIEGCPIRFRYLTHTNAWHIGKTTDADGQCEMLVGVDIPGEFGVIGLRGSRKITEAANLRSKFQLSEPQDDPFVLKLTDEQVAAIPKSTQFP